MQCSVEIACNRCLRANKTTFLFLHTAMYVSQNGGIPVLSYYIHHIQCTYTHSMRYLTRGLWFWTSQCWYLTRGLWLIYTYAMLVSHKGAMTNIHVHNAGWYVSHKGAMTLNIQYTCTQMLVSHKGAMTLNIQHYTCTQCWYLTRGLWLWTYNIHTRNAGISQGGYDFERTILYMHAMLVSHKGLSMTSDTLTLLFSLKTRHCVVVTIEILTEIFRLVEGVWAGSLKFTLALTVQ